MTSEAGNAAIVRHPVGVTVLGGGRLAEGALERALARAPALVAADGAAAAALAAGYRPEAVIGDFDSLSPGVRAALPPGRLHHVAEQDSTDFEKCLARVAAPLVLAVGVTGARTDHELAVFNALVRSPHACLVLGERDLVAALPPGREIALDVPAGTRVSLFPMGAVSGRSEGLAWPIGGIGFAPDGRVGTSNRATGPVRLEMDAAGMLLILPLAQLDAAIRALVPGRAERPPGG